MKRFLTSGIAVVITLASAAALLANIADNNIFPNLLGIVAEEGVAEITNVILGSVAVLALATGILFGLNAERKPVEGSPEFEEMTWKNPVIGFFSSTPGLNLLSFSFLLITSDEKQREDFFKRHASHVLLCNAAGAVIVGSALAMGFAEEIHQYFLNNTDLPAELSKGLANILTPEHILGMGIAAIVAVSLPLLHSIISFNKLDISCTTPKDSMLGKLVAPIFAGQENQI